MRKKKSQTELIAGLLLFSMILLAGCERRQNSWKVHRKGPNGEVEYCAARSQIALLMPAKIEILPFTKPKSWDKDYIPDGIEVYLRPLDSFGDQTKAIGDFRFELYTFRKASDDNRGERIGFWEVNLNAKKAQVLHWDKITRTYRFRLGWTADKEIKPGKYILEVTYTSPWKDRLTTQYVMDARVPREKLKKKIESGHY